ncbi:uncharacterized [Tachysurus ichikawai]
MREVAHTQRHGNCSHQNAISGSASTQHWDEQGEVVVEKEKEKEVVEVEVEDCFSNSPSHLRQECIISRPAILILPPHWTQSSD